MTFEIELEKLKTKREMMVAANMQKIKYTEIDFKNLINEFDALKQQYLNLMNKRKL